MLGEGPAQDNLHVDIRFCSHASRISQGFGSAGSPDIVCIAKPPRIVRLIVRATPRMVEMSIRLQLRTPAF